LGLLLRKELTILLSQPEIFIEGQDDQPNKVLTWKELKLLHGAKRSSVAEPSTFAPLEHASKYINFSPYMNMGLFSLPKHFCLRDVYHIFRTLALTHIIVVEEKNTVIGIITRKDLLGEKLLHRKEKKEKMEKEEILSSIARNSFGGKNSADSGRSSHARIWDVPISEPGAKPPRNLGQFTDVFNLGPNGAKKSKNTLTDEDPVDEDGEPLTDTIQPKQY